MTARPTGTTAPGPVGRVVRGTLAGAVATGVMSAVFVVSDRGGVIGRKPPRLIVDHLLPRMPETTADRVALVLHLAYGAAGGAVYRILPGGERRSIRRGVAFGLLVWVLSYEGWLCAFGILPPAHRDYRGRAVTVVLAHLVYGGVLGLASGRPRRAP